MRKSIKTENELHAAALELTNRIIKGILVSGFENDADAETVLMGQFGPISGSVTDALKRFREVVEAACIDDLTLPEEVSKTFPVTGASLSEMDRPTFDFLTQIGAKEFDMPLTGVVYQDRGRIEATFGGEATVRLHIDGADFPIRLKPKPEKSRSVEKAETREELEFNLYTSLKLIGDYLGDKKINPKNPKYGRRELAAAQIAKTMEIFYRIAENPSTANGGSN